MAPEEMEKNITYLLDREAIRDVVANYCRAVDRFDRDLLMSVYHPDAEDDHGAFVGNREDFWNFVHDMHGTHHKVTQHYVANHVVEVEGCVAHAETYFIYAALNKEGAPFSLMGGRYIDKLEKRDGKWAIADRYMLPEWAAPAINSAEGALTPEGGPNRLNLKPYHFKALEGLAKPARDQSDPSYWRPLSVTDERKKQYEEARRTSGSEI